MSGIGLFGRWKFTKANGDAMGHCHTHDPVGLSPLVHDVCRDGVFGVWTRHQGETEKRRDKSTLARHCTIVFFLHVDGDNRVQSLRHVRSHLCCWSVFQPTTILSQGNILSNLDPSTNLSLIAHVMLGITMFATYPLASFVARHVCVVLLFEGPQAHEGDDASILNRPDRRILLTAALYVLAMIPATIFTDMGKVLALAGVIGGSCLAYIGPGMLYLAVHGERFLDLVRRVFFVPNLEQQQSTSVSSNNDNKNDLKMASEASPLLVPSLSSSFVSNNDQENQPQQFAGPFQAVSWYLSGMPLWTLIAHVGKTRVLAHAQDLARKNTLRPGLRIGDVDLKGMENLAHVSNATLATISPPRHKSDRLDKKKLKYLIRPRGTHEDQDEEQSESTASFHPEPLKELLVQPEKGKSTVASIEPDPQENPPGWTDYCVAIFYIGFGVLALFAGVISLYTSGNE